MCCFPAASYTCHGLRVSNEHINNIREHIINEDQGYFDYRDESDEANCRNNHVEVLWKCPVTTPLKTCAWMGSRHTVIGV